MVKKALICMSTGPHAQIHRAPMTVRMAASPRPTGAGAQIVDDDDVFRLLIDMEIQKAQRLRYLFSVICVHVEAETATPDVGVAARMLASTIRSTDAVTARERVDRRPAPHRRRRVQPAHDPSTPGSGSVGGGALERRRGLLPATAASAEALLSQAAAMMARARQDGGRRFYIPTTRPRDARR